MKPLLMVLMLVACSGCAKVRQIGCDSAINDRVLDVAVRQIRSSANIEDTRSLDVLAQVASRISAIEEWKSCTPMSRCVAAAYDEWIWFYRGLVSNAYHRLEVEKEVPYPKEPL